MTTHYAILFATGMIGALLLLALQIFTRRNALQEIVTASWLTLLVGLWLVLPLEGRWLVSLWTPSTILGGQLLMSMTPGLWTVGLALGLTFAGVAWVQVADASPAFPLSGVVTVCTLLITWLALASGTLLTALAAWTLFDLLWGAAGLIALGDGERVTFGWLINGLASIVLWMVILLLEREGGSALWWLMVPTAPVNVLLIGAAILRIGLYPFHISFPRRTGGVDPLFLITSMNPVLGLGLLYRVLSLPDVQSFPAWVGWLGLASLLWGGLRAWIGHPSEVLACASYALLGVIVVGAAGAGRASLLLHGTSVWLAGWTLLWLSRPRDRADVAWSWPGWVALLFLVGSPPSALGTLYRLALTEQGWVGRVVLVLGGAIVIAALLRFGQCTTRASISPPWTWQQLTLATGLALPLLGLICCITVESPPVLGFLLWSAAMLMAAGLVWRKKRSVIIGRRLATIWSFLDLKWVYRSLWRGTEHVLGAVRVVAEVVEGSGAMLWSMLVILIVLLIVGAN